MDENVICINCESEFRVEEVYSDFQIGFCPYCGESLEMSETDR